MAKKNQKPSIGGQAVMEGVMMRGPEKWCLAVRTPKGDITTETHNITRRPWARIPLIRGVLNFFDSMVTGYKTLMRSAEISMTEEELEQEETPSKFEAWIEKTFGDKGTKVLMGFAAVIGIVIALVLFMVLPTTVVGLVDKYVISLGAAKAFFESVIKMALFIIYLAVVRKMDEIDRVFSYHGAEHKTIACYEAGEELTVDNVKKHTRFHPRCGTSFILIVLVVSIIIFSIIPWSGTLARVGLKLLLLPFVMGIAYELIMLAGKYNNVATKIISAPGLWLQRLTTSEPDDEMMEVAIAAAVAVIPETETAVAQE